MCAARFVAIAALAALALTCNTALAEDTEAARKLAIERYLQAVPISQTLEDAYGEFAKRIPFEHREKFIAEMRVLVRVDYLEDIARQAMLKTFTADELNALADFYSSQHGASAVRKFGAYMAEVMPALMQEVQRAAQKLQEERQLRQRMQPQSG